jgi:2-amino-4-hydroxy-6-hydroxymethyldihydropteridine diphosphokinase
MGPQDQPDFVNAVAGLLTRLPVRELLDALQAVERAAGRDRAQSQRWGPRPLDLDILCFGQLRIEEPGLHLPHPGIAERNFVLLPLLELAPGLQIPGLAPLLGLVARLGDGGLEPLE